MLEDRPGLAHILGSTDEAVFLRETWGRAPLVLRGSDPARFDGLFDFDDLETYLFTARPPAGEVRLVKNSQWPPVSMVSDLLLNRSYDVQAIYNGLAEGYTVVLNGIHHRWPAAARLVRDLEERLLAETQTNVYVTGPGSQGFGIHHDDHDVFVLQTAGRKRWLVYDKPAAGGEPALLHDVELARGDALYMPTGFPHAAATSGESSIHVTVGIYPLTWQQLARETVDAVAARHAGWQERVPLDMLAGAARPAVSEIEGRLRQGLAALADLGAVLERYRAGLGVTARRKNPPPSGYLASLDALDCLEPGTELERRPGVACRVSRDGDQVAITFMGETVRAPLLVERALAFVAGTTRFRVEEIDPDLPDKSKIVLARRLIREGLLQIRATRA